MSDGLVGIGSDVLHVGEVVRAATAPGGIADTAHGAVVTFVGTARDNHLGRRVLWLYYEAYEPLALKVFSGIVSETRQHWPSARVAFRHRTGRLAPGEASVVIAVAAPHRAEAFSACRYVIERIKQVAPVWKRETLEDGESWVEGATADPEDVDARNEAYGRACG